MRDDLAILAVHLRINQLIDTHLVIIEKVTGCVLEIPNLLSGGDVETDRGVGE